MARLCKINRLLKRKKNKEKWEMNIWLSCDPCQRNEMKITFYNKIRNRSKDS